MFKRIRKRLVHFHEMCCIHNQILLLSVLDNVPDKKQISENHICRPLHLHRIKTYPPNTQFRRRTSGPTNPCFLSTNCFISASKISMYRGALQNMACIITCTACTSFWSTPNSLARQQYESSRTATACASAAGFSAKASIGCCPVRA